MKTSDYFNRRLPALLLAGLFWVVCVLPAVAQNIAGVWLTEKGESKVEIFQQNGLYFGKIIWVKKQTEKDQRDVGRLILKDFNSRDDSTYHGKIFVPYLNKTCRGVITRFNNDCIEIRGFIAFFSDAQRWTRVITD